MMRILTFICFVYATASASKVTLEWDPSPDSWVAGYRLYASTNSVAIHGLTNALVKLGAGTNTTCTVSNLAVGRWYFVATAYTTEEIESLPSNEVIASVATAPANMRTVVVQWSGQVASTNWQDAGFMRIKFGP